MSIKIYGKEKCPACKNTCDNFRRLAVEFTYIDVTKDTEAMEEAIALGHKQLPIVVVEDEAGEKTQVWSGFHPYNIIKAAENDK